MSFAASWLMPTRKSIVRAARCLHRSFFPTSGITYAHGRSPPPQCSGHVGAVTVVGADRVFAEHRRADCAEKAQARERDPDRTETENALRPEGSRKKSNGLYTAISTTRSTVTLNSLRRLRGTPGGPGSCSERILLPVDEMVAWLDALGIREHLGAAVWRGPQPDHLRPQFDQAVVSIMGDVAQGDMNGHTRDFPGEGNNNGSAGNQTAVAACSHASKSCATAG